MTDPVEICRICMSVNIKMFSLKNTNMENLYKLLTQVYVDTKDGKPTTVCFLCYARLRQCDRLQQQAVKANELLEQLLKGGLVQAATNEILKGQYSSQVLQVSSTYYLDLEPANCEDVLLDPKVEVNDLISVKEEVEVMDEGRNVTEDAILNGQYCSRDLQVTSNYYLDLEPVACEDDLLDPKVEASDLISVKEEVDAIDEGSNVTENLCIMQHEKRVTNYPHTSNLIQFLKKDKTFCNNAVAQEITMKPVRILKKKESTLIRNKQKFQITKNDDKRDDKKSEKKCEKTKTNVVSSNQNIQKSIHDKDTQEENVNSPQTSVINTIIGEFQCNECGKQFSTKGILANHILKCMNTTETSLSDNQLTKADTEKSLLSEMYSCNICSFKTNRKLFIETHLKVHNVTKIFYCDICMYRCADKRNLKTHMRTHTGEKPFSCNICVYRCAQKVYLNTHMRTHTGEKPFSCNICKHMCSKKGDLKIHMRTHTGEKPFSCNICEYRCSNRDNLKTHMRTHTGEKPFSCNICKYRSSKRGNLKTHMRTHTGEKPFSCNICKYRCSNRGNLKTHMRTHTDEKPFSCNICKYRCLRRGDLKTHMRTHTGEKPFSCNICKFKCSQKAKLKEHIRIHTGEKPFSCNICEYRSARKNQLKVHLRTHS